MCFWENKPLQCTESISFTIVLFRTGTFYSIIITDIHLKDLEGRIDSDNQIDLSLIKISSSLHLISVTNAIKRRDNIKHVVCMTVTVLSSNDYM